MKYLQLRLDDTELFDYDTKTDIPDTLVARCNISKFRKMFKSQGSTFWLRHLMTLRFYYYEHVFLSNVELSKNYCQFYMLKFVESAIINIHERYIEDEYDSAKRLMSDIYEFTKLSHKSCTDKCTGDLVAFIQCAQYSPGLFGAYRNYDKNFFVKLRFAHSFYIRFYFSICSLFKRYDAAPDLPADYDDNYPDLPYWMPFENWEDGDYQPKMFEKHIAKFWGDKLPKMLLTPDVHNIFRTRPMIHRCVSRDVYSGLLYERYTANVCSHLQHRPCSLHKHCLERLLHDKDCGEPHFCLGNSLCIITCDTESEQRRRKIVKSSHGFWKCVTAESFSSNIKGRRNACTQAESYDRSIETYVAETYNRDARPSTPPWYLPPEIKNSYNQMKRKADAVCRLREKLGKKQEASIKNGNFCENTYCSEIFQDQEYRRSLYKRAVKKFSNQLRAEQCVRPDFVKDCDGLIINLPFLEKFTESSARKSSIKVLDNNKSIGVGYDGILYSKIVCITKDENNGNNTGNKKSQSIPLVQKAGKAISKFQQFPTVSQEVSSSTKMMPFSSGTELEQSNGKVVKDHQGVVGTQEDQAKGICNAVAKPTNKEMHNIKPKNESKKEASVVKSEQMCAADKKAVIVCNSDKISDEKVPENNLASTAFQSAKCETESNEQAQQQQNVDVNEKYVGASSNDNKESGETVSNLLDGKSTGGTIEQIDSILASRKYQYPSQKLLDILKVVKTEEFQNDMRAMEAGRQSSARADRKVKKNISDQPVQESQLHVCAYCAKQEVRRKSFKKCAQCKAENFPEQRYYCSRECQAEDWKERHKLEHRVQM